MPGEGSISLRTPGVGRPPTEKGGVPARFVFPKSKGDPHGGFQLNIEISDRWRRESGIRDGEAASLAANGTIELLKPIGFCGLRARAKRWASIGHPPRPASSWTGSSLSPWRGRSGACRWFWRSPRACCRGRASARSPPFGYPRCVSGLLPY